jgi:2',3'-cyclic-nucleotide 2'-phosphodiesterase (5'-nucleotidase family)
LSFFHSAHPTPIHQADAASQPQRIIILHTNDIHGRTDGIARVATMVDRMRSEHRDIPIFYFDLGDVEERTIALSSLTKGAAMHRLLSSAGCDAAAIGNAALASYGAGVLLEEAASARYPLLMANLRERDGSPVPGTQPRYMLQAGSLPLGLIGLTTDMPELGDIYESLLKLRILPVAPTVRELCAALRQDGAGAVILLSHMGLAMDRQLASELQGEVALILGGHTHDLLPEGERIGEVAIAQAGQYAQHLGRVDALWDGERLSVERMSVIPITEDIPPSPLVLAEMAAASAVTASYLDEIIGELAQPLDFAYERECGTGNLVADMLRERLAGDIGLAGAPNAVTADLPAGPVRRRTIWEACPSPANPCVATLSGEQLVTLVARGLDPVFAAERPRVLRFQPRGILSLSGAAVRQGRLLIGGQPASPERRYRVAATDWELDALGGYAQAEWHLSVTYDFPTIVREALETYLQAHRPVGVEMGRVDGPISPS